MKKISLILLAALALTFSGCAHGAATLPELCNMVFEAYKANSLKKLDAAAPPVKEWEAACDKYYGDAKKSAAERKEEASKNIAGNFRTLHDHFGKTQEQGGIWEITGKNAKLADYKYETRTRPEDYQEGTCRLFIGDGQSQHILRFTAAQFDGRWYLTEGIEWEK